MSMRYDPLQKKTRIPFRVVNGQLVHFYDGTPIKDLSDGTVGDIVVNNYQIKDKARVSQYNSEQVVPFLPSNTLLIASVSLKSVPKDLRERLLSDHGKFIPNGKVEIFLEQELMLRLRGTKHATFEPCVCRVPALQGKLSEDEHPTSVNHAYILISTHFEPHRQAKGGNVFDRVFYCSEPHQVWQPLSHLRDQKQAEHEINVVSKSAPKQN